MSFGKSPKLKVRPGMGLLLVATLALIAGAGVEIAEFFAPVIPNEAEWAGSGHADTTAEAFTHWDEEGEISTRCAQCHSTSGHLDFLGVDGTEAGVVDHTAPLGATVECIACHNEASRDKDRVVFPSGLEVAGLGASAHNPKYVMQVLYDSIANLGADTSGLIRP